MEDEEGRAADAAVAAWKAGEQLQGIMIAPFRVKNGKGSDYPMPMNP